MENFKTTRTPQSICPTCKTKLSAATSAEGDHSPEKDSISVCFGCGEILIFDKDLKLTKITKDQVKELDREFWLKVQGVQFQIFRRIKTVKGVQ